MARPNKRMRLLHKLAKAHDIAREQHTAPINADNAKLQQGSPRTSYSKYANHVSMRGPKFGAHAPAWYRDGARMKYQGDK